MTLLLAAGADATALNRIGRSPLESAAEASNVVAIQALLGAGVDMTTHPDGGYTPLDRAACCSSSEAMGFLRPWEGTQRRSPTTEATTATRCCTGSPETVRLRGSSKDCLRPGGT